MGTWSARSESVVDEHRDIRMSIDPIASLKESLARKSEDFRAVFDANPVGMAIARDTRCEQVMCNAALDAMLTPSFCWAPPVRQADEVEMLEGGVPLSAEQWPLWRAAALGEHVQAVELEIRVKGRPPRTVVASATPLVGAEGQVRGAIASMIDITEERASQKVGDEKLVTEKAAIENGAGSHVQPAGRARDEFLAMLSHELRNPLNAIATAVEVLNRAEAHAPVAISARRIIGKQTRQLASMLDRLLRGDDVGGTARLENETSPADVPKVRLPTVADPSASAVALKRILLVEDNLDALYSLQSMLEFEGYKVQTAIDGPAGLAALLNGESEVAILDIGLPGFDGYEIAKRGRAGGFAGPLIALTAYGRAHDEKLALAAGFDAHVVKPAELKVLLGLIQG